jgi:hypothetical protein
MIIVVAITLPKVYSSFRFVFFLLLLLLRFEPVFSSFYVPIRSVFIARELGSVSPVNPVNQIGNRSPLGQVQGNAHGCDGWGR